MSIYRYSGWDGNQDSFDLDADELMDELGRSLMSQGDLSDCLCSMQREGISDSQGRRIPGIEELLQQLNQMKQGQLENHKLRSMMDEMLQRLDSMLKTGQPGTQSGLDEVKQKSGEGGGQLSPEAQQNLLKTLENLASQKLEKLNELMEHLRSQIAQAQSSSGSLSPVDRESLENVLQSVLNKFSQDELARLSTKLEALYPSYKWREQYANPSKQPISDTQALKLREILQKLDKLEAQLKASQYNGSLDAVDEQLLKELMGDERAEELERLRDIPRVLEEAGYIRRKDGKCELTPRGTRKIGQKALEEIFAQLRKDHVGGHNINLRGTGGERIDDTKKYEYGDNFQVHLEKTIRNSLYREGGTPPIKLKAEDFEVFRTEGITRSATVLMLDLSFSMAARGRFQAARRVAIALDSLIRSQYPKDSLHIVGFSSYARRIKKEDLSHISWDEFDIYTNIQHGLFLARKLLVKEMCTNKQIILVSDGEPTAHVEGENEFFYQAPPSPRTIQLTLKEVKNCTQKGIVINTFMLENDGFLSAFVTQIARINKGRVFFANAENLGQYLLVDYIANKKRCI